MSPFLARLEADQLTAADRRNIRSLLFSVRAAEETSNHHSRPIPPEWRPVIVRADDVEAI